MSLKPITILVVDDKAELLSSYSIFLKSSGHVVLEARSSSEGIQIARDQSPDLILLGHTLPDEDLVEMCRRIRSEGSSSRAQIILVTEAGSKEKIEKLTLESGADGYLTSPFSQSDLLIRIRSLQRSVDHQEHLRSAAETLHQELTVRTRELEAANWALQQELAHIRITEEKTRTSEAFFKAVTENSSDVILIINKRGIVTYASPSVERFFGYTPNEMVGKSTFRFIHPDDNERAKSDFNKALLTNEISVPNSFRVLHKDGSERVFEGLGRNLLNHPLFSGFIMNIHEVTDYRRLERSSRLFGHTLESISEFVTITDLQDRFIYVNEAFLHAYGYKRDEVIGNHVSMLLSPNNPEGLMKEILEANRTRNWSGELLNLAKDGREFPILLHTSRIRNARNEVIGLVGIAEDITERKRAELEVRQSEAKYRDLVEHIADAIFATDMNGVITYISPTAEFISGYKPEEMIGHSSAEFIDPAFLPLVLERYQTPQPGRMEPIEYRVKIKSGKPVWIRSSARVIYDGEKPIGMRGVLTDITKQKLAEETVKMLSHAAKSIAECVSITDRENKILFVNQAFLSTYGYSEQELIGKGIEIVNPQSEALQPVAQASLRGAWKGEMVNRRKDGTEFPIYLSRSVVLDETGKAVALVGVTTDITERKRIERELSLQRSHLEDSYIKLRELETARDTLLHMIVHDMRSRLSVLNMGLELLDAQESKKLSHANRRALYQALSTTRVLNEMVNALLDINKMESGEITLKPTERDLRDMCRTLVSTFEIQQETRRFIVDAPDEPVTVSCDHDLIGRVIQNLFSNALKFTPPDGTITVKIDRTRDGVRVSVEDTGPGIPEHHLPKIFDKFYQAEVRGVSTGIGLTFCKLAVELHGGSIGVTSDVGKGSKFWFTLPAA